MIQGTYGSPEPHHVRDGNLRFQPPFLENSKNVYLYFSYKDFLEFGKLFRDFRKIKIHTRIFKKYIIQTRTFGNFQDTPKNFFWAACGRPSWPRPPK